MQYLKENGVDYVFVKVVEGITTYKYKKTKALFDKLSSFYAGE